MCPGMTRRKWMRDAGVAAAVAAMSPRLRAADAPSAPVAIAKCNSYGPELAPVLTRMFDQLGGLGRLVKGKTVAIKINLTGLASQRPRPAAERADLLDASRQ